MREKLTRFTESDMTQNAILALIILNSIVLGLETSDAITQACGGVLEVINVICLVVFTLEVVLKIYLYKGSFFKDGWNLFDFFIVAVSLVPTGGVFSSFRMLKVFRVFRSFRSLRMVTKLGRLRLIVQAIISSIPSIAWTSLLLGIIYYIFAISGTELFGESFPEWFGSLPTTLYTLFKIMTLESWSMGICRPVMEIYPWAALYFIIFILFTAFIVLNVVIGVVVNTIGELSEQDKIEKIKANSDDNSYEMYKQFCQLKEQMLIFQRCFEQTEMNRPPKPKESKSEETEVNH